MAIFNSYVSLPEGTPSHPFDHLVMTRVPIEIDGNHGNFGLQFQMVKWNGWKTQMVI
jgi:hypothetical protein